MLKATERLVIEDIILLKYTGNLSFSENKKEGKVVAYARVANSRQKKDVLNNQV